MIAPYVLLRVHIRKREFAQKSGPASCRFFNISKDGRFFPSIFLYISATDAVTTPSRPKSTYMGCP